MKNYNGFLVNKGKYHQNKNYHKLHKEDRIVYEIGKKENTASNLKIERIANIFELLKSFDKSTNGDIY